MVHKNPQFQHYNPDASDSKESTCSAGDLGSSPGSGRCPGTSNGNPLQCSWLENPTDRGAWRATYSPWGRKESDMTERLTLTSKHQKIWHHGEPSAGASGGGSRSLGAAVPNPTCLLAAHPVHSPHFTCLRPGSGEYPRPRAALAVSVSDVGLRRITCCLQRELPRGPWVPTLWLPVGQRQKAVAALMICTANQLPG